MYSERGSIAMGLKPCVFETLILA